MTRRSGARRAGLSGAAWLLGGLAALAQSTGEPGLAASAFPRSSRPIAEIVSPIWATERERDAVDEVGQVARRMGLTPGQAVADLGAGSGYYTVRLARRVGPSGRVYAEDVTPPYLEALSARVKRLRLVNVEVVRGETHDPRLPAASVDAALLIHMYHEIEQPFAFLYNLVPSFRPGARVGIVDLDAPTWEHGTPPALLRCELAAIGYREVGFHRLRGDVGYLAVFEPPAPSARPAPGDVKPCPARPG